MYWLKNPHLDILSTRIHTPRCTLSPYTLDGTLDIQLFATEFCKANKNLYVSPYLPTYEEEYIFIQENVEKMKNRECIECTIYDTDTATMI
jgi:hypothetical protein